MASPILEFLEGDLLDLPFYAMLPVASAAKVQPKDIAFILGVLDDIQERDSVLPASSESTCCLAIARYERPDSRIELIDEHINSFISVVYVTTTKLGV